MTNPLQIEVSPKDICDLLVAAITEKNISAFNDRVQESVRYAHNTIFEAHSLYGSIVESQRKCRVPSRSGNTITPHLVYNTEPLRIAASNLSDSLIVSALTDLDQKILAGLRENTQAAIAQIVFADEKRVTDAVLEVGELVLASQAVHNHVRDLNQYSARRTASDRYDSFLRSFHQSFDVRAARVDGALDHYASRLASLGDTLSNLNSYQRPEFNPQLQLLKNRYISQGNAKLTLKHHRGKKAHELEFSIESSAIEKLQKADVTVSIYWKDGSIVGSEKFQKAARDSRFAFTGLDSEGHGSFRYRLLPKQKLDRIEVQVTAPSKYVRNQNVTGFATYPSK